MQGGRRSPTTASAGSSTCASTRSSRPIRRASCTWRSSTCRSSRIRTRGRGRSSTSSAQPHRTMRRRPGTSISPCCCSCRSASPRRSRRSRMLPRAPLSSIASAGKDRTGLVTALLLRLAGVVDRGHRGGLRRQRREPARAGSTVDRRGRDGRGAAQARTYLRDARRGHGRRARGAADGGTAAWPGTCATAAPATRSSSARGHACEADDLITSMI